MQKTKFDEEFSFTALVDISDRLIYSVGPDNNISADCTYSEVLTFIGGNHRCHTQKSNAVQHGHIPSTHRPVECHIDVPFQTDDVPTLLLML